ncbi:MAG: transglutaminase domain-containing protein [Clostridiaceae bacterium]|nr:transglutaminase domain-containing protein [Clostridiaceae bacterium]
MNILKGNKAYIVILFVNLMFTFKIIAESYLMIDFNLLPLIAVFTISVIGYFLFDFIFKKSIHKIIFLLSIITIGLAYIFYFGLKTDLYFQVSNNIVAINEAVKSASVTYYEQYELLFMWFIPLLVFLFLLFASKGITNLVLIYSMVVMILFWYLGFPKVVKGNLGIFTFIGIMSFGINNCIASLRKLKKSNPNMVINSGVLSLFFLIPALLISIVTTKLPQEYKGNYIGIANGKLINTFGPVKINLIKSTYGLEASGYSSDIKKLGGPITVDDKLFLTVKSDKSEYLRGSIKDNYNGFAWSKNKEDYSLKVKQGYSVLTSKKFLSKFLYNQNESEMVIYPEKNKNSSIFSPIYTYNVQLDKGEVYYDDIPTFVADLSKAKSYSINYYNTLEAQAFENCSELEWLNERIGTDEGNSEGFTQKYGNYLQVPSSITQRTRDLLESIAPFGESRYNSISKIKEYLDKNYPYTTSVSEVPENQDFVDNFLFTEKKGYCVYFATAATILCRMQGIPARYVEGFKMPGSKDSDGLYKVTNKEAHAWCEVLVDPAMDLWTTLEVTPAAVNAIITPILPVVATPETKTSTEPVNKVKEVSKDNDKTESSINIGSYKLSKGNIFIAIFVVIITLIVAKILFAVAQTKKILKGTSIIPYYHYCIKRLKRIGINKPANLGDLEYVETINDSELKEILKEVVIIVYDEFYGKKSLDNNNRSNSYKRLEAYIKSNENKSKYFIKKYFFF